MEYVVIEIDQPPYEEATITDMSSFEYASDALEARQTLDNNCDCKYTQYRVEVRK